MTLLYQTIANCEDEKGEESKSSDNITVKKLLAFYITNEGKRTDRSSSPIYQLS